MIEACQFCLTIRARPGRLLVGRYRRCYRTKGSFRVVAGYAPPVRSSRLPTASEHPPHHPARVILGRRACRCRSSSDGAEQDRPNDPIRRTVATERIPRYFPTHLPFLDLLE